MNQTMPIRVTWLFILLSLMPIKAWADSSAIKKPAPIRFATLEDFKPFAWCDNGVPKGIDVEIVTLVMDRIDHPYVIECIPWKRALSSIKSGKVDALFSAYKTSEREAFAIYMNSPTHLSIFSVFVPKGKAFSFNRLEDLYGKTVGITGGYSVNPEFDKARLAGRFKVQELSSADSGLKMLARGRLDAYVNGKHVGLFTARNLGITDMIEPLDRPLHEPKPAYLLFSKASNLRNKDQLISEMNQALDLLWKSGEVDQLTERFILTTEPVAETP